MIDVDTALVVRMTGDAMLAALLSTYNGQPAVILDDRLPPGVRPPFIHITGPLVDVGGPFDAKNADGRQWATDVGCYAAVDGNTALVETIAERVRYLFNRKAGEILPSGWAPLVSSATGPVVAETDETLYGRIVTVTVAAMEA